ncbi:MAG: hypothetical protein NTZ05_16330 [Chloroflexi bacterium]|nr:hypothetical protein [Chloroflexota bacterium]
MSERETVEGGETEDDKEVGGAVVVISAAEEAPQDVEEEDEDEEIEVEQPVPVRAVVLDMGRPTVPTAWRSLPPLDMISQGIREADRRRR